MRDMDVDLSTSVTEINNSIIVALADEMTDNNLERIMDTVTAKAHGSGISGVILNFSMVKMMDTHTFNAFKKISKALSLMGAGVVWVGLRPGVVCALMDLNVEIDDRQILTAINLEQGLALLSENDK